jgi:outer membrane protein OmpA-like peptidoglycan-associated protein
VLDALEDRGVASRLLSAVGRGGSAPVVPHSDEQNRWKNRRVDFILQR